MFSPALIYCKVYPLQKGLPWKTKWGKNNTHNLNKEAVILFLTRPSEISTFSTYKKAWWLPIIKPSARYHSRAHFWAPLHFPYSLFQASIQHYQYVFCTASGAASYRRVSLTQMLVIKGYFCYYLPMPSAKLGYSSSVKSGSGSSRKYSFNVPAMALTSISLIITDTSLLSERGKRGSRVNKLLALHLLLCLLWLSLFIHCLCPNSWDFSCLHFSGLNELTSDNWEVLHKWRQTISSLKLTRGKFTLPRVSYATPAMGLIWTRLCMTIFICTSTSCYSNSLPQIA